MYRWKTCLTATAAALVDDDAYTNYLPLIIEVEYFINNIKAKIAAICIRIHYCNTGKDKELKHLLEYNYLS